MQSIDLPGGDEMKGSCKIYAAGLLAFCLGFSGCLGFMTASFLPQAVPTGTGSSQEEWPVIVIDAGHGGFDGGAQAADGTKESGINLAIAKKLADIAAAYEVEVVMTRDSDAGLYSEGSSGSKKREDLLKRKDIMEESGANLAVSIHLNSFPQDTSVYGAQVFYPAEDVKETGGRTEEQGNEQTSQAIAESVQNALESRLPDGRQRSAMKKDDILLFQNPPCPIILAECGFLSNPQEASLLKTAEYQQKLAEAIWQGIDEILCFGMKEKLPVIDSTNREENAG